MAWLAHDTFGSRKCPLDVLFGAAYGFLKARRFPHELKTHLSGDTESDQGIRAPFLVQPIQHQAYAGFLPCESIVQLEFVFHVAFVSERF